MSCARESGNTPPPEAALTSPKRRAVFFDRDGVLNHTIVVDGKSRSPRSLEEFEIDPEAREALLSLRQAGYLLLVATNQPEVHRGLQTRAVIEGMHRELRKKLPLDDICVCFHDSEHACKCRKPEPGLLVEAAGRWGICLKQSYMVGDRWKDVEAGRRAGCRTVILTRPYDQGTPGKATHRAASLSAAVAWILGEGAGSVPHVP
jgi:D-glycero-D-manno-heptose 1,7-bisphosphate phosphatase